ncbi:ribonuclease P [Methanoculleus sp. FWC-SCC1]|uniref:Ribonuclease P protein component 2 n=1 Tax=Methanoculleus frigidifontis TaxID=2584085 RepID=A0ABT8M7S9_9EURY|nr:Rpp14/Pop5 family protein [Methanoculleus sp. FWC-SCC1]MDN7023987.1 ribonuclease P [Methanoculleus sp. FWC-SCC1]
MKPRPPVMRQKRRYILARIVPPGSCPDQKQAYLSVLDAATALWGDAVVGLAQPAVVFCDEQYLIVRCRRGSEDAIATALATVTAVGDRAVALRTMAVSGTIHALKRRMRQIRPVSEPEECVIGERYFTMYRYPRQKVDLVEKSIKTQKLLFLTETDLEER